MAASSSAGTTGSTGATNPSSPYPAMVTTGLAGVLQAYTAVRTARANSAIDRFEAEVADMNARQAEQAGIAQSNAILAKKRQTIGAARAGFAGQGVVVDTGTGAVVEDQLGRYADQDAQTARNNAFLEAWGFKTTAIAKRFNADQTRRAGNLAAIGSLLTTGAKIGRFASRADLGPSTYQESTPSEGVP